MRCVPARALLYIYVYSYNTCMYYYVLLNSFRRYCFHEVQPRPKSVFYEILHGRRGYLCSGGKRRKGEIH